MVLLNKAALSSFDFNAPMSLLFFQCIVCVILVRLSASLGFIKVEPWNPAIIRLWFPVNLIFVGMIFTSFFALKNLGVPMATVLKNLTNLFTIGGDYLLYKKVGLSYCQLRAFVLCRPEMGGCRVLVPVFDQSVDGADVWSGRVEYACIDGGFSSVCIRHRLGL